MPIHTQRRVELGDGYAAHFAALGKGILMSAPEGAAGQWGIPRFAEAREAYLRELGWWETAHVELKDYAQVSTIPSRASQAQFLGLMKAELARGFLRGLVGYGMPTVVRWIFNAHLVILPDLEGFEPADDYPSAVHRAFTLLRAAGAAL